MLFTKDRPKTHEKQTMVSAEEAYRLWAKASLRYTMINHINLLSNYAHDLDFKLVLKNMNEILQNQARMLEDTLNEYSIKSPEPNKRDIEAVGNAEVAEDRNYARIVYSLLQLSVSKCFLSIKDSILNDNVRELLFAIVREEVELFESYTNFMLLKGWLEEPPLYKSLKNAEKRVATNEIWHLWDLLHNRYLNQHQTKYFVSYVMDKDFQLLLSTGIDVLERQINKLEETLLYYGVNLPNRPPKNIPTPESQERMDDKFIFKVLFLGMKNATTLHGIAIEELVINQKIRDLFKNFLFEEMDLINKIIKYGKLKGWVPLDPQFRSG